MFTIYDYLKYYKDYDLKEVPWNNMDNLFLSILVYIPSESFRATKSFSEICDVILNFNVPNNSEFLAPKIKSLIEIIKDSKRYENLKIQNFENIIDNNTQFGAMVCKISKNKIIVFKGTDRSIIGWIENFRPMYQYPTYSQALAIKYLKNNIGLFDKSVYVIGHSKGGNMAMTSVMELSAFKFNKIKKVINFDGSGFMKNEYESFKYKKMSEKLTNIVPSSSYIGVLMHNENYTVIKTNAHGFNVHYPIYWLSFGTDFIKDDLSKISIELNERTTKPLDKIDQRSLEEYFEAAFKAFDKKKTSTIKFHLMDFINVFKNVRGLDKSVSDYVNSIIKSMLKLSKDKE